jgi:hypothetical protein
MRGLLLSLYPDSWKSRYGQEFRALLEELPVTPATLLDIAFASLRARITAGARALRPVHGLVYTPGASAAPSGAVVAALLMLVPSVIALIAFALKFKVGVDAPFDSLWPRTPVPVRFAIVALPLISFGVSAVQLMSGTVHIANGQLSATLGLRFSRSGLLVVLFSTAVALALVRYFTVRPLLAWSW